MLSFVPGFLPFLVKRLYTQSRSHTCAVCQRKQVEVSLEGRLTFVRQFQLSKSTLKLSAVSIATMLTFLARFHSVRPVLVS